MDGRKVRRLAVILAVLFAWCAGLAVNAASLEERLEEVRIEQAQARMPQMKVYYYREKEQKAKNIKADFDGEKLSVVEEKSFQKTGEGIQYYILLDVSASIGKGYFEDVKNAVGRLQKEMNPQDLMTVITFGDEVKLISEKMTPNDDLGGVLAGVRNTDMNTLLFQAVNQTAELIGADEDAEKRNVVICITDGEDFSQNKATGNEALATLNARNVPLYAMAVKENNRGKENAYIDEFGEFSRSTGAYLTMFGEGEAWDQLSSLRDNLEKARVLTLMAPNNHTWQEEKQLTLEFGNGVKAVKKLVADKNIPDDTVPTAAVKKTGSGKLQITYSENVEGAGDKANYIIKNEKGDPLAVYAASYDQEALTSVLTFAEDLENGSYVIAFQNIHDPSMEANPVSGKLELTVKDAPAKEVPAAAQPKPEKKTFMEEYGIVIGIAAAVIVIGAIAVAVIVMSRKKKEDEDGGEGGTVVLENGMVVGADVQVKQHIALKKQGGQRIVFELKDLHGQVKQIPVLVNGSLIVGRTDISDIYFDDEYLSKQHFAISEAGGVFYIEDLNTKNGTMINGIRIQSRRALNKGDIIRAGSLEMRATW